MTDRKKDLTRDDYRAWCNLDITRDLFNDIAAALRASDDSEYQGENCEQVAMAVMEKQGFKTACQMVLEWAPESVLREICDED